jgi:hypothetical protein
MLPHYLSIIPPAERTPSTTWKNLPTLHMEKQYAECDVMDAMSIVLQHQAS